MALNRALTNQLRYACAYSSYSGGTPPNKIKFSKNNVFQHYLETDLTQEILEYPPILNEIIRISIGKYSKLILPLYVGHETLRRSSAPLLKDMLSTITSVRLTKTVTNSGEVFYGNESMILNKDFKFLMVFTLKKDIDKILDRRHPEERFLNIHPRVFKEDKDMLSKMLINKIMPFFMHENTDLNVNVQIRDMDWMIKSPVGPAKVKFDNEEINNLLEKNIDEIVTAMT